MAGYVVFLSSELDLVDFGQVLETSKNTVRLSVDRSKTFVNWDTDTQPDFIQNLTEPEVMEYEQIIDTLSSGFWTIDY
jgi:hypothetical protein